MGSREKLIMNTNKPDRWMAEIKYQDGCIKTVLFEEIEDLDALIESGPDWNTIENIVITLNRPSVKPQKGVI